MAYYLQFDGSNDYVDIPEWVPDSLDYSIELVVTFSNFDVALGNITNQNDGFIYFSNGVRFNSGTGYDRTTSLPAGTVFGDRLKIEIFSSPAGTDVYVTNLENGEVSSRFEPQVGTPTFNAIGKFQTGRNLNGDFYYLILNSGSDNRNYDPSASGGAGQILPDTTVNSNDGTLVNFPTDNSQWVFFDDGGAGQLDIVPIGIASQESFGSGSVSLVTQFTSPTSILTQEALGSPTVAIGAVILQPPTIPSQESVEAPTVVVGGIELAVPSIGSEGALGNAIIQSGGIIVSAPSIGTEEAFGTAVVNRLLELIEVAGIASQEQFERPVVLGGDKIAIPIPDRQTWNRVATYLRTLKFKGSDNDVICAWLRSEGYEDQYNAMWEAYLEDEGLEGSLTDKYSNWKRQ